MIIFVATTFHYPNMDKDINRIKVVLVEKKRTNKWLAEQLGCAPTTVSKWCTNACQPPMETYIKIAKLLNITIEELINKEYVNSASSE
jgi:DNA-binding XRE family transcriptional regulator